MKAVQRLFKRSALEWFGCGGRAMGTVSPSVDDKPTGVLEGFSCADDHYRYCLGTPDSDIVGLDHMRALECLRKGERSFAEIVMFPKSYNDYIKCGESCVEMNTIYTPASDENTFADPSGIKICTTGTVIGPKHILSCLHNNSPYETTERRPIPIDLNGIPECKPTWERSNGYACYPGTNIVLGYVKPIALDYNNDICILEVDGKNPYPLKGMPYMEISTKLQQVGTIIEDKQNNIDILSQYGSVFVVWNNTMALELAINSEAEKFGAIDEFKKNLTGFHVLFSGYSLKGAKKLGYDRGGKYNSLLARIQNDANHTIGKIESSNYSRSFSKFGQSGYYFGTFFGTLDGASGSPVYLEPGQIDAVHSCFFGSSHSGIVCKSKIIMDKLQELKLFTPK